MEQDEHLARIIEKEKPSKKAKGKSQKHQKEYEQKREMFEEKEK